MALNPIQSQVRNDLRPVEFSRSHMSNESAHQELISPAVETVEMSRKGKWFQVPSLRFGDKHIVAKGKWIRIAEVHEEEWLETELENPSFCIESLKRHFIGNHRADIFSFSQKVPQSAPKYHFPLEWDSVAVIPISTYQQWWEGVPQETRKNVRRSQKRGVKVVIRKLDANLLRDLMDLNNDDPLRQGKRFTHYGKTLDEVEKDQQSFLDRSEYICAYSGDELIGVLKLVFRGEVASILTFLSKKSHQDKRPANALMAKAVEVCEQKQISHVIFGMYNYGNKKDTSLREFKIRNGFQELLMPHFFVPLTFRGWIAVKLKIHRGLIGLLPQFAITPLLRVRTALHHVRMSRCSSTVELSTCNRQMGRSNPPAGSNF
jgi:hypothetical protein